MDEIEYSPEELAKLLDDHWSYTKAVIELEGIPETITLTRDQYLQRIEY